MNNNGQTPCQMYRNQNETLNYQRLVRFLRNQRDSQTAKQCEKEQANESTK